MIRINLIPAEIRAAQVRRQLQFGGIVLAVLTVAALMGFWGTRVAKARRLDKELVLANEELKKYQAIVDRVNELEQTRNQLKARRDVIQQLLKGSLIYPRFFEDFMALLPAEVWVTSMSTSLDAQGTMSLSLNAQSLSNFAIADWLTNLQKSPNCSDVKLGTITTQETPDGRPATLSFSLTLKYARRGS